MPSYKSLLQPSSGITSGGVIANPRKTCGMYLAFWHREDNRSPCSNEAMPLAPLHCVLVPMATEALPHGHREIMILSSWNPGAE